MKMEKYKSSNIDWDRIWKEQLIKKKWEEIYEFNIIQFISRTINILDIDIDEYESDYSEGHMPHSDEECLINHGIRRNSYFDDDNWRQREHDTEESFRLAGD